MPNNKRKIHRVRWIASDQPSHNKKANEALVKNMARQLAQQVFDERHRLSRRETQSKKPEGNND